MQRVNQVSVDMLQIVRCYVMLGSHIHGIHGHGVKHFCSGRHKVFRRGSIFSSQGELTPSLCSCMGSGVMFQSYVLKVVSYYVFWEVQVIYLKGLGLGSGFMGHVRD